MAVFEVLLWSLFRGDVCKELIQDIKGLLAQLSGWGDDKVLDERPKIFDLILSIILVFFKIGDVYSQIFFEERNQERKCFAAASLCLDS